MKKSLKLKTMVRLFYRTGLIVLSTGIRALLKIANGTLRHYSSVKIILAGDVKDAETERRPAN